MTPPPLPAPWAEAHDLLRRRGLRWTPQRRTLIDVLAESDGHVLATELVERCRALDPTTTPSTVYRTLDVLEHLGLIRHGHGADGREEYHLLPEREHGHIYCDTCGSVWELEQDEAAGIVNKLRRERGFAVDVSHVTIVGRCADCAARDSA